MSALQFIAAIAWPFAILVVAILYQPTIAKLLGGDMKRMRAGPFELELEHTRAQVVADLAAPTSPAQLPGRVSAGQVAELGELAASEPRAVVLEGFARVETALRELLVGGDAADVERMTAGQLMRLAEQRAVATPEALQAVEGLTVLRNLAAHGRHNVGEKEALDYLVLVDAVLYSLRTGAASAHQSGTGEPSARLKVAATAPRMRPHASP